MRITGVRPFDELTAAGHALVRERGIRVAVADDRASGLQAVDNPGIRSVKMLMTIGGEEQGEGTRMQRRRTAEHPANLRSEDSSGRFAVVIAAAAVRFYPADELCRLGRRTGTVEAFENYEPVEHRRISISVGAGIYSPTRLCYSISRTGDTDDVYATQRGNGGSVGCGNWNALNETKHTALGYLAQAAILLILTFATVYLFEPTRQQIGERMDQLRDHTIELVEQRLGRQIRYASISPSIITRLEIRDLDILHHEAAETDDPLLSISSVQVRYRVIPLLLGRPADSLRELRIRQTDISVDVERDRDLVRFFAELFGIDDVSPGNLDSEIASTAPEDRLDVERIGDEIDVSAGTLPPGVLFSARNVNVEVVAPDGRIRVEDVYVRARQNERDIVLQLRARVDGEHEQLAELGRVQSDFDLNLTLGPDISYSSGFLDLRSFSTDVFELSRQQLRLQSGVESIEVRKVQDSDPVDLVLRRANGQTRLEIAAEEYRFSELGRLRGAWGEYNEWLSTVVSGEGSLTLAEGQPPRYDARIITDLPEERFGIAMNVDARVAGDNEQLRVPEFRATVPFGRAIFAGTVDLKSAMPTGSIYLDGLEIGEAPRLSTRLNVEPKDSVLLVYADRVDYADSVLYDVNAQLSLGGDRAHADLSLRPGDRGSLRVSGSADLGDLSDYSVRGTFDDVRVAGIYEIVRGIAREQQLPTSDLLTDSLLMNGTVGLEGRGGGARLAASTLTVTDEAEPRDHLELIVEENAERYEGTLVLRRGEWAADTSFSVRAVQEGALNARISLILNDENYDLTVLYNRRYGLTVMDDDGSQLDLVFLDDGDIRARADVVSIPVPMPNEGIVSGRPRVTLAGELHLADPEQWQLDLRTARIEEVAVDERSFDFSVAGQLEPGRGVLERIEIIDDYGTIEGTADVTFAFADGISGSVDFRGEGDRPGERYEVEIAYDGRRIDGRALVRESPLARLEMEELSGWFNGDFSIDGWPDEPIISVTLSLIEAELDGEEISAEANLEFAENRLTFGGGRVDYLTSTLRNVSGAVDLTTKELNLMGDLEGVRSEEPFLIRVQLDGTFGGEETIDLRELDPERMPFDARLVLDGVPIEADLPSRWELSLARDEAGIVRVNGGPDNSIRATIDADGEFTLSLAAPLPFSVDAEGRISATEVEANLTHVSLDVERVPEIFDLGDFRFVAGKAEGSLRMTGPIFDPDLFGTLTARGVEARLVLFPDTIGPADGHIVFSEKEMRVQPLRTPVGQAEANFEGVFLISRWELEQFELDIETVGTPGPHVYFDFGGVHVDGYGRGSFSIVGTGSDVRLLGNIVAHNTTVTLSEVDEADSDPPGPDDDGLIVDLEIDAGRGVEFLWPTTAFPILRAVARPGDRLRIGADTLQQSFQIVGDIGVQGGELFYFDRSFIVREGMIRFNETEDDVDPRLTVRAETRDVGPDGPVRISLVADESRLSELTVRVVSDPPLPEEEVLAMLGTGVFTSAEDGLINLSGAVLLGGELVGQFGVIRTVESSIRNALQLDLFTVRTQLFQNLVRGAIDEPADDMEAPMPSLGRYFDNTTMFLGRSLGPDVFLELLVQLRSQDLFEDAERQFAGVDIDTELSLEFETPYFNIEWSFMPQRPESLFVPDNRLTLSWGFTY